MALPTTNKKQRERQAMASPILPCPFCGSVAKLGHVKDPDGVIRMAVTCTGDGCWAQIQEFIGDDQSVERVIATWNRRAGKVALEPPAAGDGTA
jgi:hypothetical protein